MEVNHDHGPKRHELKTWPHFFEAVAAGRKKVEVRFNDRDYKEDDILVLKEWEPWSDELQAGYYTGKKKIVRVTHILFIRGRICGLGRDSPRGLYAVMSIEDYDLDVAGS